MRLSVSVVYFTFLNLHNAAAQSQMCNELFQAVITLVTNVTYPASATFLILILSSTENFFVLQKRSIERRRLQYSSSRCFPVGDGGYHVRFTGTMMLHGEYGGDEWKLVIEPDRLFYQHQYVYEACKQQGIIFQIETVAPVRVQLSNPGGFVVYNFQVRNRVLEEGTVGVRQGTAVNSATRWTETRFIYTFL